jgi:two-component system, cell cycle sensor histidine kinase and response regulator CckA
MIEEIMTAVAPVVVIDARTDPRTNKDIVARLGNRTIINLPLRLLDKPFGALGVGTFGDEGVRPPTAEDLEYLVGMASQVVVAAGRIRFLEERARAAEEKVSYERRVAQMQKLESLGLLAGGIAHDFNNLLTVILTTASALAATAPDETTRADAEVLVATAERGRALTRQLLAMSRSQPLRLEVLDLNRRLASLTDILARVLPATIEVELACAEKLPAVEADASQLDQVLMNLCINARDAMPKGGRLTLMTEEVMADAAFVKGHPWAKPGRYVLATVTDTGIGMAAAVRERVFEPFFTTKTEGAGTGLGLAVAYGIVVRHGGMLSCQSEPGAGARFLVYLPVRGRAVSAAGVMLEGAVAGGHERILVAEDDAGVRGVIGRVLRGAGYAVELVTDGVAACEAARKADYDLVLLDVIMPAMTGPDALREIRSLHPGVRFVLSSGYVGDTSALALVEAGDATMLEKPYDPDTLLRTVRHVLDRR